MSRAKAQLPSRHVRAFLATLVAISSGAPASAHLLSVSQGELTLDGPVVTYELRMPLSEVPSVAEPQFVLLDAIEVRAGGQTATREEASCQSDAGQELYTCRASYRFVDPPSTVDFRCDFPSVTVPHHVHILRSGSGETARQTVFDITFREAEIRFVPPTIWEVVRTEAGAGVRKPITSPELFLFLIALALAARSKSELAACAGAFLIAQAATGAIVGLIEWMPPIPFLEAAAALAVAYLAAEILFVPDATKRWLVCGGLGCFHGLFLAAYIQSVEMHSGLVLPGALGTEGILAAGFGALRLRFVTRPPEQLGGILLLVVGMAWFGLRVLG